MPAAVAARTLTERALDVLRRAGNPFRNYFARNADDEVCARYHVPELFVREREQLLGVIDLYRYAPTTHSEVVPVLGNKGSGKTHLLHSIKHGGSNAWQLLVTPGTYQRDAEFLEYLLFQLIDTLLGGGRQKDARPLEFIGEQLVCKVLTARLSTLTAPQRLDLFPSPGLGRWGRALGLGGSQAQERTQWLSDSLARCSTQPFQSGAVRRACEEAGLSPEAAFDLLGQHVDQTEAHNTAGLMRRAILQGFARAVLLHDEADLASFLTYGFAELEFQVRPSRQDLVLALFRVVMEVLCGLHIPVVVAFDQLEDLLLARRSDDGHRTAEAFFAGIVQAMHNLDGISFLIFAERGLWNRFVPSLDGYIQDRLNNPLHLPNHGTLKTLRLEAPPVDLVHRIVAARLRPALEELPDYNELTPLFPFTAEQVERVARTEPTLRDMLQQLRHQFDHVVFGTGGNSGGAGQEPNTTPAQAAEKLAGDPLLTMPPQVKSVVVVQAPLEPPGMLTMTEADVRTQARSASEGNFFPTPKTPGGSVTTALATVSTGLSRSLLGDLWDQEIRSARRQLEPEGALTGATRELQAGLGAFLQVCHEHGVKVGPWRLNHVVGEWTFGDHPTYGAITIAHWVAKAGQPWKVGIGLFLGRGPAKLKDLQTKLNSLDVEPAVIDHLILLRPEDDLTLTGKSKTAWQEAERRGRHARLEPVALDAFAVLYAFPRVLAVMTEMLPEGQPLPNLADLLQEKCEKLLEQVCMPVQG